MLALPRLGCINLHGSLLPRYRGAAPIQWAVANGDAFTGNTTMLLEEGLDTGPILLQQTVEIKANETAMDLFDALAKAGAPLMVETLAGIAAATLRPQPQNHAGATFAPLLDREDGRMDFATHTAHELYNRWRGFQPWPGAFTTLDGKKLIVHRMEVDPAPDGDKADPPEPGQLCIESHRIFVCCAGNTWLELLELQLEGKKRLPASEFLRGNPLVSGSRLGTAAPRTAAR
jgi:methionyl-tRNA formyltransferase